MTRQRGALPGTTQTHTFFFREPTALEAVRDQIVAGRGGEEGPVTLWCVGCASGDEPCTLAIVVQTLPTAFVAA